MIRQLSDRDAVAVEVIKGNTKIIAVSMYVRHLESKERLHIQPAQLFRFS